MNPFYYSPTDPRGPWIYVPAWPESAPKNADNYPGIERDRYKQAKAKALEAGIGVRPEDNGLVKRKAFCSTPYWPLPDMDEQDAEIEAWQPAPDTVYWLPLEVEIFEQYIEPPDTIHCNRGGDRKYVRIIPNKEEPKPDIVALEKERLQWSLATFKEATALSSLLKLKSEVEEIIDDIAHNRRNPEEYADALMCLFDSAGRLPEPIFPEEIFRAFAEKLAVNKNRSWAKNKDNSYSHVKPEEKKEYEKPDNEKTLATIWFDVANGSWHKIHEAIKNDPIAYFASIEDLLKYDHFYRNGLADRPNQDSAEYLSMKEMCDYYKDRADKAEKILREAHTISFRGKSSEESNERRKEINKELLNQMELEAEEVNKKEILEFLRIYEDNRDSGRNYSTMVQTLSDLFSLSRKKQ